ncbi:predicted protein [Methanosarcina acetivorans C2A]|uniref:Uncharacterized protein n=1 Tax=Methanosarcina acetivorans (strain ATCC 35395 / DSM 2834 / JCM 12185 / C2A) TaxID=188937 RepID=Q8TK50_METAC|nr:predicted protein [Methanosarcina acetivorans C2A]
MKIRIISSLLIRFDLPDQVAGISFGYFHMLAAGYNLYQFPELGHIYLGPAGSPHFSKSVSLWKGHFFNLLLLICLIFHISIFKINNHYIWGYWI